MDAPTVIGCIVAMVVAFWAARFLSRIWPDKGKWGINREPVDCPGCGQRAPAVRRPANRRQRIWGGWTCTSCGTECDKYGREVPDASTDP